MSVSSFGRTGPWSGVLDRTARRRGGELAAYAYLLTGDRLAAQGLMHDAMIRTFAGYRGPRDEDAAYAAVRRTMLRRFLGGHRSRAVDRARLRIHRGRPVEREAPQGGECAPITAAMWLLDRRQRACVVLCCFDGLGIEAAAEQLGVTAAEVARHLDDAMPVLRAECRCDVVEARERGTS